MKIRYVILTFIFFLNLFAEDVNNNQVDIDNSTYCTNCLPPIANPGESKKYFMGSESGPTTVTIDGGLSYDPEGADLTYQWSTSDNLTLIDSNERIVSFVLPYDIIEDTYYTITLIVNDGDYNSNPVDIIITSAVENTAPEIDLNTTDYSVVRNKYLVIDASLSVDQTLHSVLTDYVWDYDPSFVEECEIDAINHFQKENK